MKGGIASRLTVIFSLLVLVATVTVGVLVFGEARQSLYDSATRELEHTAETIDVRFQVGLQSIAKDVQFLASTPPVSGIVRASADNRPSADPDNPDEMIDRLTNHSLKEWMDQLADIFSGFLESRPSYYQISYIGVSRGGREIVRVDRTDGEIQRVPRSLLQRKWEQIYFRETIMLPEDGVYFSEVDYLQEEGEAELPGVPILRVAVPVYETENEAFGVIVLHADYSLEIDNLKDLAKESVDLFLSNGRGDLLAQPTLRPDSSNVLTADIGEGVILPEVFPSLTSWFEQTGIRTRLFERNYDIDAPYVSFFRSLQFMSGAEPRYLVLGMASQSTTILAGVMEVRNRSAVITLLFCLGGIVLALVSARFLTRPLRQVTQAISRFGQEQQITLPVRRQDEIGVLARAYDTMAGQIKAQILELEEQARRQRIILETSAEGIIVTDAFGTIETFNGAAERIFGYTTEEVMGHNVNKLVFSTAQDQRGNGQAPHGSHWGETGHQHEVTGRRKSGKTFPLSLALSSFELGGEKKYAGFIQDITKRKQHEQTLRQAKLTAEAASRAKSAFLANMSHEIRTPLTGIIGFASLLAKQVAGKHKKYANLIENSGVRLKETLNSVLDLAKLEANRVEVEPSKLEVGKEVEEMVQLFQNQAAQKGLSLEYRLDEGAENASARLDRGGLNSIMHNLLGNALKFTEEGGIFVTVGADADKVYIHVQDTGIGINEDFIPHLFEVFRQESSGFSRTHEGSGLGLSITQKLVSLMDGEISVESEKGEGSTFTVSFPLAIEEEVPETWGDGVPDALFSGTKSEILVVEDNDNTRYLIESLLEEDYEVTVVSNAEDALLHAFKKDFDLVLMDINLGVGPNGADVLRELRAMPTYQETPIVAITAYALPGDKERFLEMGFTDYLSKPFNADELLTLTSKF